MANLLIISLVLSVFVATALSEPLVCFDCDPLNDGVEQCKYPVTYNARNPFCNPKENHTPLCLSAYIQHKNESLTGTYRGCVYKPLEVGDVCDWLRETNTNRTYKSCHPCNETRCNTVLLYADGTSDAGSVYNMYFLMIINLVIVMIFGNLNN
ncbi:unnamed protein product [Psylliodes chrysocephalus]|uniref:Uncharacterized protein n=1 Tax=Psylliodes chrysocephalus TaxID=3402493 RepID=A0A9P0CHA4_9CUCU|nr:unnamed protein product [Psylliodes chrysocephala]